MADCGAAGTAIDRAAVALGSSTATGKHVSSLFGHVAMANGPTAMPLAPPMQLQQQQQAMIAQHAVHHQQHHMAPSAQLKSAPQDNPRHALDQAWSQQQQQQQQQYAPQQQQHQQQIMMQSPMMQQQHYQQMMIQQQQQMMHMNMMMQKQHQHHQHHQQQKQQQQQQQKEIQEQNLQQQVEQQKPDQNITLDNWHDGLEDDLPQGATIDDLAAAWAQAEAEYDHEAAVNMASAYYTVDEHIAEHPYQFLNPLPDTHHDHVKDWMKVGVQEYESGNLVEAIRAFETLVQVQDDHAKAWYYLGKCHAENDQDVQAIACLERSVERDPFAPETLLALGVSYVNELNHNKALQNLKEWITHNPKYAGLQNSLNDLYGGDGNESELDQVQGLLLRALEHESSPDVHEAMGVVYNVSRDYDAAVASFDRALQEQPGDYSLWNKLGATLANSNASERALPAYQKALQLRPKYARAWLNMAISHSNLQNYHEAARCYLQTLSLNPAATHCWSYLRIALSCQEQWDMLPLISDQDLKAFREHYDFVLYE